MSAGVIIQGGFAPFQFFVPSLGRDVNEKVVVIVFMVFMVFKVKVFRVYQSESSKARELNPRPAFLLPL